MKYMKYLIAAFLIFAITKKTQIYTKDTNHKIESAHHKHVIDDTNNTPSKLMAPKANFPTEKPISFTPTIKKSDLDQCTAVYDPTAATVAITFTDVIATNPTTTPPNLTNKKLKFLGLIPSSNAPTKAGRMIVGRSDKQALWGIPQTSTTTSGRPSVNNPDSDASKINYNAASKTATVGNKTYVGVQTRSASTTPLKIMFPFLQEIGSIPNPSWTPEKSHARMGGSGATIELAGIPVSGSSVPVKHKKSAIGTFWSESNIVQLNNGTTYVAVLQQAKVKDQTTGAHAMGPIWTRFDENVLAKYNIKTSDSNFQQKVNAEIGSVKIDEKKYTLAGVNLYDIEQKD